GRVLTPPMRRHRLARPYRAAFSGRIVANREDEIHHRRIGTRELLPALRAQIVGGVVATPENLDRKRIYDSLRLTAGGEAAEMLATVFPQDRFRQDRTGAVTGAQEENV